MESNIPAPFKSIITPKPVGSHTENTLIAVICLHLSSKAKFGHDPVVGAFAVGPEEVAAAKEPAAADLGRRCATHVPNIKP